MVLLESSLHVWLTVSTEVPVRCVSTIMGAQLQTPRPPRQAVSTGRQFHSALSHHVSGKKNTLPSSAPGFHPSLGDSESPFNRSPELVSSEYADVFFRVAKAKSEPSPSYGFQNAAHANKSAACLDVKAFKSGSKLCTAGGNRRGEAIPGPVPGTGPPLNGGCKAIGVIGSDWEE